jgi:3-hydroxybutyryl-CoA dehydratase
MNKIKVTNFADIRLGQSAEISHTITEDDIQVFGELSGDFNPLHFNQEWAETTFFRGRIAHGILTTAYISTVIGMHLPGPGTIYIGQSMKFFAPVRIGDTIAARVEVIDLNEQKEHVTLRTTCTNQNGTIVLDGEALVGFIKMK